MSRKGENIYKRKDNRWEARYVKGYSEDGAIKYGYIYAGSYHEAKDRLQKAKTDIALGVKLSGKTRRRFNAFALEWMQINKHKITESTYVKYLTVINNHILPYFGGMRPEMITTAVVSEFACLLTDERGLSSKTVRDILTILSSVLKYAKKEIGVIMPDVEIIYPKSQKKEMRVLSLVEQERLISVLTQDMDEYKFGILLALITGLRIGELCALRWEHVDFEGGFINVKYTMQRLKNTEFSTLYNNKSTKIIISDPKSEGSARKIPLTENAKMLCKKFYRGGNAAFVLTGEIDRFHEPRKIQYHFSRIVEDAGLSGVHFHSLRHTFATRCVEVGFEIKSLSEILGHSSPKITLERYVHSSMELKRDNMSRLSIVGF